MSDPYPNAVRSISPGTARVVEEMVVMLGEMDIHDVRVSVLARRAGVAIPTVYYNFRSLTDIIVEATVVMIDRFLGSFSQNLSAMARAAANVDEEHFRLVASDFMELCWSSSANDSIRRLAPLITYFRQVAPEDVRLREVQARELTRLIEVLYSAQGKDWISRDDDAAAFAVVHYTCVLGQAIFWHPAFGPLTTIDFSQGTGRLRYQTTLQKNFSDMLVPKGAAE
ncbi:MAG: TetR/AcrR family transcriptional regulator [Acidimicrobiaceae bacterium]|nr:TetR/AcrR family transcriptional regulator [Acidimicrobiaceae bacterium]